MRKERKKKKSKSRNSSENRKKRSREKKNITFKIWKEKREKEGIRSAYIPGEGGHGLHEHSTVRRVGTKEEEGRKRERRRGERGWRTMRDFMRELVVGYIYAWKVGALEWE